MEQSKTNKKILIELTVKESANCSVMVVVVTETKLKNGHLQISTLCSVITVFILLSFFRRSSLSSCSYLSTASTSHTFHPCQTACQAYAYPTHFSPTFLLIAAHRCPLRRCSPFLLACLLFSLSGDIELNPGPTNFIVCTLNIRSILHPLHSAALSDLIVSQDSHQFLKFLVSLSQMVYQYLCMFRML